MRAALILIVVLAASRASAASPSGDIESVLVFADRAKVTRARAVTCEKGTARAAFDRLPAALDVRTLRGDVREAAEVIGLSSEQVNERETADPRARALAADLGGAAKPSGAGGGDVGVALFTEAAAADAFAARLRQPPPAGDPALALDILDLTIDDNGLHRTRVEENHASSI